jgi:adenylate cyclase
MRGPEAMKKKSEWIGDFFKKKLEYCVAFFSFLLFILISVSVPGKRIEFILYNGLLALKPAPEERKDMLLVNINDESIEEVGAWPWSRDVIADVLIRMRESGSKYAVFDIEYLNPGQAGVNRLYVKNDFPAEFTAVRTDILGYVKDFSDAIVSKSIPLSFVTEVSSEMSGMIDVEMKDLSASINSNIFQDNDEYFGKALRFFGNAYLTINSEKITENTDAVPAEEYAYNKLMHRNVVDKRGLIVRENILTRTEHDINAVQGIAPAILPLLSKARGAGFPNVVIDEDGVRRRIPLLVEYKGAYIPQLVLAPILDILSPESVVRTGNRLLLVNALDPADPASGVRDTISIPLDEDGRFLINWLKKEFIDNTDPEKTSFHHVPIIEFKRANDYEEKLLDNLVSVESLSIKNSEGYLSYRDAASWLHASWRDLVTWKNALLDGEREDYDEYFTAKKDFFSSYGEFLSGGYDVEIYDTLAKYESISGNSQFAETSAIIKKNFDIYRSDYAVWQKQITQLNEICAGSFCVIGNSATGSTDLGVNPFSKSYANVGTHANIYNTIMTKQFITPLPRLVAWAFAFAFCYFAALANRRLKSLLGRIGVGLGMTGLVFACIVALFAAFRMYIQVFVPLFSVFITFILITILRFAFSEQEKSFLRKAFTTYLSADVVDQIVDNPELLKLGGQEKQITALFTDIKSFSTLSEKVTPEHLVQILNKYLTVMSNIVLDQKGTIDKYIGDAIVSFFGAPLDLPDHATRACLAAVRMKEAEARLNEEMLAAGETPSPIYTRIGINTGSMVVGNMGTDNKMNYTIMGNDVNLAARLEGVNKSYATWILVSESTWNETHGTFVGRKLDRVRVVGINTPVQLYNIMGITSEASAQILSLSGQFNLAIDAYREKRFGDSLKLFDQCREIDPDDEATKIFYERVATIVQNGVPDDWSDVINMTSK